MIIKALTTEGMEKTEKSTATENTKTEKSTATEKTKTIDDIATTHTSQNLSGNIVVFWQIVSLSILDRTGQFL